MIEKKEKKDNQEFLMSDFMKKLVIRTLISVITFLLLLSLISYPFHPEDSHILEQGLGNHATIGNWIGLFGAYASRRLLLWFGFAAYIGVFVMGICVINRVFNRKGKPANKIYIIGIVLIVIGSSMLMGVFPDLMSDFAIRLNIASIPGGVIGQRFCAPWTAGQAGGWLAYIVNPVGSMIISIAMIIVGVIIVWRFDWHDRAVDWKNAIMSRRKQSAATKQGSGSVKSRIKRKKKEDLATDSYSEDDFDPDQSQIRKMDENPVRENLAKAGSKNPKEGLANSLKPTNPAQEYKLPTLDLLNTSSSSSLSVKPQEIDAKKRVLQDTLDSFSIDAEVGNFTSGPRVTLFEIKPAAGVKVERISSLANNIAMNLKAENLRILTPIPGKDTVGIEVPNRLSATVSLRGLLDGKIWQKASESLPLALGTSISGKAALLDLSKAPHLLIAGATGSGKSVCMNTIILSLLYRFSPDDLKLIMVDPKVVEFSGYNSLPHLVTPVVTQVKKVPVVLRWVINQMEWRYDVLSKVGVRNIAGFNARKINGEPILDDNGEPIPEKIPYLVVIIDELADIMMTAKADVETSLARIAQLARAVGIHVIVATQRPSVNVITGIIKANFPTRIAFQVTSVVDSRTILDGKGAEALLGRGDMLFKPPGGAKLERIQGAMVDDDEIERVVAFVSEQAEPEFKEDILNFNAKREANQQPSESNPGMTSPAESANAFSPDPSQMDGDEELINKAIEIIMRDRRATTSHIQRRLRIGYNRAALIIEILEQRGIVGPQVGTAPRQILIETEGEPSKDASTQNTEQE